MSEIVSPALTIALDTSVMLHIADLERRGGPTDFDFDRARASAETIAAKSDVLMFGSKKKGEAARVFAELAFALAVMAFVPGGVSVFGRRYVSHTADRGYPP